MVMRTECRCKKCGNVTFTATWTVNDLPWGDSDDENRFHLVFNCAICTAFVVRISETMGGAQSFKMHLSRGRNERASHDSTEDGEAPTLVWRHRR